MIELWSNLGYWRRCYLRLALVIVALLVYVCFFYPEQTPQLAVVFWFIVVLWCLGFFLTAPYLDSPESRKQAFWRELRRSLSAQFKENEEAFDRLRMDIECGGYSKAETKAKLLEFRDAMIASDKRWRESRRVLRSRAMIDDE